ncbi:MAG: tetratricopeptide repeat protein [Planctomycetes bacterium]|nr:tetratricopeptide repeat protein [Planctomycetota bacterium]
MMGEQTIQEPIPAPMRKKYLPAVGPRLKVLLVLVLALFSLLSVNSLYLSAVTFTQWATGQVIEDYFYIWMFFLHLVLGLAIIVPVLVFGGVHIRNAYGRPNRRAVRAGIALFATSLILLGTGILLTRIEGVVEIRDPDMRSIIYWLHVITPVVAIWLFILHRLAGRKIRWRTGLSLGGVGMAFAIAMAFLHSQDPRVWNVAGPKSGEQYFFPSLARTATGNFIPARALLMDEYCQRCHPDIYEDFQHGVHKLSSFNNPAYLFSVKETRRVAKAQDGTTQASRFCAGCHDPVPFYSGAFDDPKFDDPAYDLAADPLAQAGITCTTCHSITHINSVRGNADYTIEEAIHYPFAFSDNTALQWLNNLLVKSKPGLHKKTFLKPLHQTAEFCGSCHKVHLPEELNKYRFLRGQNHYDSFLLSGVSGHGAQSFYYPDKAQANCNGCHMKLEESTDFGARRRDESGLLKIHNHQFPSANTALPALLGAPAWAIESHHKFNDGVMRVDIFGLKVGGNITDALIAPIRPEVPALAPGATYLLETVIRTLKMGHDFTQGTADSNEVWLDVELRSGERVIGRSGEVDARGEVDPWAHFVNAYVLDRHGEKIDRRNAQDIFVPLYNNQIPPGAADVVHFRFKLPADIAEPVTADVKLKYRKFNAKYMRYVHGEDYVNALPVITLASDSVTFPVARSAGGAGGAVTAPAPEIVPWQRWNDYGIGLLRKGMRGSSKGELRQAEAAFAEVEKLGIADGPLNRARVYVKEGRVPDAVLALKLAAERGAYPWVVAWFTGIVNVQNGNLDDAIANFTSIADNAFAGAAERDFDFSRDYRVLNELGKALFERAKQERGEEGESERRRLLEAAAHRFHEALALDPENVTAHYNLSLIYPQLGAEDRAREHGEKHRRYKTDDNAQDLAISKHRAANEPADHAAEAIVIYDLQRPADAAERPAAEKRTEGSKP